MVQAGSQQYKRVFFLILKLSYLIYSQIWLNLPMDGRHFWLHHKIDPQKNTNNQ
jgi:hypothetical protein